MTIIMKTETKYLTGLLAISSASMYFLFALLRKHNGFGFESFIESCQQIIKSVFSHGNHIVGLGLVILVALMLIAAILKLLFSTLKTKRRLGRLTGNYYNAYPKKILTILKANKIDLDIVRIVKNESDFAATVGTFRPRVVISTGTISRLSNKELEAVVLHEIYHQKSQHGLLLVFGEVVASCFFFLPAIKELVKKMRGSFETEADKFAIRIQKTDLPIQIALSKVEATSDLPPSLGFSGRTDLAINKTSLFLSILVILFGIGLYFVPNRTLASVEFNNLAIKCGENMCSTDCDLGPI